MYRPFEGYSDKHTLRYCIAHSRLLTTLLILLVFAACVVVLSIPEEKGLPGFNNPVVGQEAPKTLYAKIRFSTPDFIKTREEQQKAIDSVPSYYMRLDDAGGRISGNFQIFFQELLRRMTAERRRNSFEELQDAPPARSAMFKLVKSLPPAEFLFLGKVVENEQFRREFIQKVEDKIVNDGILPSAEKDKLPHGLRILMIDREGHEFEARPLNRILSDATAAGRAADLLLPYYDGQNKDAFKEHLRAVFLPLFQEGNLQPAEAITARKREEQKNKIGILTRTILPDSVIVEKQTRISDETLRVLSDYRDALRKYEGANMSWSRRLEKILLCALFLVFTCIYVYHIHPELTGSNRSIWLIGGITVLSLLANRYFAYSFRFLSEQNNISPQLIFLALPLGLPAILLSVLYGLRSAIYVGLFVSGIAAVALDNSFPVLITGLLVSGVTGYAVRHVSDYKKFFMSSLFFCSVTTFLAGFIFTIHGDTFSELFASDSQLPALLTLSVITGLATSILALVLLFLMESTLDVTSNMAFLTYTDRNHPLLKRLQLEAPGTYHHSERVASIAEKAAGLVGANPMRVQACALFHDIGKLSSPGMFTENSSEANPHAKLSPRESAELIRRHVTYGLELGRKYKLKSPLLHAIEQHHGTDFISFFYELAKKEEKEPPAEADFRYPGPLPDTKETALLSLADCTEAMARSISNPTEDVLRVKIAEIFLRKLENGQLDHAPLTVDEIHRVQESFLSSLMAMGHARIAYPSFEKDKK